MDRKEHGRRWKGGRKPRVCPDFEKRIKIEKVYHILIKNKIKKNIII
jgi:hypothetical protein